MQNLLKLFARIGPEMWTCVTSGEFNGPNGRIQVVPGSTFKKGTSFMGIDLANLLEDEYQKKNGNANLQASQSLPVSPQGPKRPLPPRA